MEPLTRQALLRNATAQISKAGNYSTKAFNLVNLMVDPIGGATNLLRLQTMVSSGAVGSIQGPTFSCPEPAVKCTWDEFDTIAACASYTNTTNTVEEDCQTTRHDTYDNTTCTFTFPEGKPADLIVLRYANNTQLQWLGTSQSCALEGAYLGCGISPNFLNGVRVTDWGQVDDYEMFSYEAFTITLNWCIRTYHSVTASPAGIQTLNYTSSPLVYSNRSIAFPDTDPSNIIAAYHEFYSNASAQYFNMTFRSLFLLSYVNGLFVRELNNHDAQNPGLNSGLSEFLYYTDLSNLTANLEETLTNQIRNSSPGDNLDGEMWPGQAFYQETYWHVHWPWVVLPIAEAVITIILLGVTIIFSRKQPLFKSSPLALLFHPLEGYKEKRFVHEMQGNGVSKLQDLAKDIRVEFKEDEDACSVRIKPFITTLPRRLTSTRGKSQNQSPAKGHDVTPPPETHQTKPEKKTMEQLDEELRLKMSGIAGDGGESGVEYEDGKPVAMKRSVKDNMFRYI
ncbi:hypothetical protein E0Z10_g6455 [Xylaria hypoxylon]|uniref:Uncharacterized protein n=1 Tax=Xylaria hypoxylon TaxID=37992 RepID=A0A4Z0YSE6_9PEZI|nr:hypothetical protein E0Z10_g6455 [Xylaria hypoxylon]